MCHRKRWPRSSFLSQERPWPQTFCKIRPILAKNLYFSAYFPLFLLFSWRRILANHFNFLDFFGYEWKKKERFGREISLPKVALSSLKMQRKCRKEKDKKFCLDETKWKMAREPLTQQIRFILFRAIFFILSRLDKSTQNFFYSKYEDLVSS